MKASHVVDHWRQVRTKEYALVAESGEELLERAAGLSTTQQTLRLVMANGRVRPTFQPRIGNLLLHNVYRDAVTLKTAKKSPQPALAFLREVVIPMSGVRPATEPAKGTLYNRDFIGCRKAEGYFNSCVTQINTGRYQGQRRISVYHDTQGAPLFLRKTHEVSSGIILKPLSIEEEGTEIPTGTYAALRGDMSTQQTGQVVQSSGATLLTYLVDGPLAVSPKRSGPWAYDDPLDRSLFALKYLGPNYDDLQYDHDRGRVVEGRSLDDFVQAASRVMEMCQA